MNALSAQQLKITCASIFARRGGAGAYTDLFERLGSDQRTQLTGTLSVRDAEFLVVGGIKSSTDWFLLTTGRLAWCIDGQCSELPVESVKSVSVDLLNARGRLQKKFDIDELIIETFANETLTIKVEPGRPLHGVLSILMHLARRNQNAGTTPTSAPAQPR